MKKRLRIISVCRNLPTAADPSVGVFVLNRLAALGELADLQIVQPVPYAPPLRPLPDWVRDGTRVLAGLRILPVPMPYVPGVLKCMDGTWLARSIRGVIKRLHSERKVDLIDAHFGYPDGVGCVTIGRELGIPVFVTVRGNEHEWMQSVTVRGQLVAALRAANGCIAVSRALQDLLIQRGVRPETTRVIRNAVERDIFSPGDRNDARLQLGLDQHRPLVVSIGHLVRRKRHHILIEAFARVRRAVPDANLAIIGARSFEADYPQVLQETAQKLGLRDCVRLVGNVPQQQVVQWLRAADVFALLSAREGCCNAILEALATGTPVIATPTGENSHFVHEGRNGWLVPVDAADAAGAAISAALQSGSWNRGEIADYLIAQVGDWRTVAERVLEFFQERLSKDGEGTHGAPC